MTQLSRHSLAKKGLLSPADWRLKAPGLIHLNKGESATKANSFVELSAPECFAVYC